jgi:hypothetical protein
VCTTGICRAIYKKKATTMQTNSNRFHISLLFPRNIKFILLLRYYSSRCLFNNRHVVYFCSHIPPLSPRFKLSNSFSPCFFFLTLMLWVNSTSYVPEYRHFPIIFTLFLHNDNKRRQCYYPACDITFILRNFISINIDHILIKSLIKKSKLR